MLYPSPSSKIIKKRTYKKAIMFSKPEPIEEHRAKAVITIAPVRNPFRSGFDPAAMAKDPDIMQKIPPQIPPPIAVAQ